MSEPEGAVITQSGHSWSGKSGRSLITRIALSRSPVTTPTANPVSFLLFYLRIISHAPFPFLFLLAPGCQRFGPRSIFWSLSFFLSLSFTRGWLLVAIPYSFLFRSPFIFLYDLINTHHLTEKGLLHQVGREYDRVHFFKFGLSICISCRYNPIKMGEN